MFNWLRVKVRNAVLAGMADAVEYLNNQTGTTDVDTGEQRLLHALKEHPLPLPEPANTRKKGSRSVNDSDAA